VADSIARDVAENEAHVDLEGLAQAADEIGADTGAENDRLKAIISEIADMAGLDLGEPEMERAAIIDRCKAEVARWEREDA
jgi:hypothetical protein